MLLNDGFSIFSETLTTTDEMSTFLGPNKRNKNDFGRSEVAGDVPRAGKCDFE